MWTHSARLVYRSATHRAVHFEYWVWGYLGARLLRHWRGCVRCLAWAHASLSAGTVTRSCVGLHLALLHISSAFLAGSSPLVVLILHESLFGHVHRLLAHICLLLPGRLRLILSVALGRGSTTASSYHLSVQLGHLRIEGIWLTFLGRNRLVRGLDAAVGRVGPSQVDNGDNRLATNGITIVLHRAIHEPWQRLVSAWVVRAVEAASVQLHILRRHRKLRIRPLIKRSSGQPEWSVNCFTFELHRGRSCRQVQLTGVVILVFAFDHAAEAAHPARVPKDIDLLDSARGGRRRHLLQFFASVHNQFRLFKMLDTHVVLEGRSGPRSAHFAHGTKIHLMNSIAAKLAMIHLKHVTCLQHAAIEVVERVRAVRQHGFIPGVAPRMHTELLLELLAWIHWVRLQTVDHGSPWTLLHAGLVPDDSARS